MIAALCAFACGIVLRHSAPGYAACGVYVAAAGALLAGALFMRRRSGSAALLFLFVCLGAITARLDDCVRKDHIANFALDTAPTSVYTLSGTVIDTGTPRQRRCLFKLSSISARGAVFTCTGVAEIIPPPAASCGDAIIAQGAVRRHYPFHRRRFPRVTVPQFSVQSRYPARIRILKKASWHSLARLRGIVRDRLSSAINQWVHPPSARIIEALIIGERAAFPRGITLSLMRTGTIHILSVSGFHVGLILALLTLLLKIARVPRRLRACAAIPLLIFYCLLTGASSHAVRSTIMGSACLCAYSFRKEPDAGNALGLAGLLLLAFCPDELFQTGFQLSFASVLSLVYFYPRFMRMIPESWVTRRPARVIIQGIAGSFFAWLGTAAIVAAVFQIVTPVTLIANLVIIPLSALALCSGLVFLLSALVLPCAAPAFAASVEAMIAVVLYANRLFESMPGAYFLLSSVSFPASVLLLSQ